jgi:hypothetical protein
MSVFGARALDDLYCRSADGIRDIVWGFTIYIQKSGSMSVLAFANAKYFEYKMMTVTHRIFKSTNSPFRLLLVLNLGLGNNLLS